MWGTQKKQTNPDIFNRCPGWSVLNLIMRMKVFCENNTSRIFFLNFINLWDLTLFFYNRSERNGSMWMFVCVSIDGNKALALFKLTLWAQWRLSSPIRYLLTWELIGYCFSRLWKRRVTEHKIVSRCEREPLRARKRPFKCLLYRQFKKRKCSLKLVLAQRILLLRWSRVQMACSVFDKDYENVS